MTPTAATSDGAPRTPGVPAGGVRRTRGKNKAPAWRRDGSVSVIRLPLAVDVQAAVRLEGLFGAMFALKRALQHDARAKAVAARLVSTHGGRLTVEDCTLASWFRLWGRACAAFTPGMLTTALSAECTAVGGRLGRASTFTTGLSQHCLCGHRVPKPLSQRMHHCPACGLEADRDLVSAALGAFVTWTEPTDPRTASVDFEASRHALSVFGPGLQGALAESIATRPVPALTGGYGQGGSRTPSGAASARSHPERRRRRPRSETREGPHRTDTAGHRTVSTSKQALDCPSVRATFRDGPPGAPPTNCYW